MEHERKEIQALISSMMNGNPVMRSDIDRAVLWYVSMKEPLDEDLAAFISCKEIDYELPCDYEEVIWPKNV